MVEHFTRNEKVVSSILTTGSKINLNILSFMSKCLRKKRGDLMDIFRIVALSLGIIICVLTVYFALAGIGVI